MGGEKGEKKNDFVHQKEKESCLLVKEGRKRHDARGGGEGGMVFNRWRGMFYKKTQGGGGGGRREKAEDRFGEKKKRGP